MGLSKKAICELTGADRKTQFNYEKGDRSPTAEYLWRINEVGADITYIVTGVRSGEYSVKGNSKLTADFVQLFEGASPSMQKAVVGLLKAK